MPTEWPTPKLSRSPMARGNYIAVLFRVSRRRLAGSGSVDREQIEGHVRPSISTRTRTITRRSHKMDKKWLITLGSLTVALPQPLP